ncbi:hypothetical protein LWI28_004946 [Acer negundo]|uniref:Zinc finger PHD-type domain-containing protein n=1 Tax=Acer negundo TaxID=4023 RepID=A0AAD5ID03_ACENE|nr:hypothetical protein LWI28_004946 [Acer negundo]
MCTWIQSSIEIAAVAFFLNLANTILINAADSAHESNESDDEFQICEISNGEEERKKLLQCSCCGQLVHAGCLVPPVTESVPSDWSCHSCKEKTEEYLQSRHAYLTELLKRFYL